MVLVSVGRRPYTEGLGLQELGIELDKVYSLLSLLPRRFHPQSPSLVAAARICVHQTSFHREGYD